jgi:hypothetical protein
MRHQRAEYWSRREFLGGLTLAGTAGFLGLLPDDDAQADAVAEHL